MARWTNKTILIRSLIVVGLLGAVAVFFAFGFQHEFNLQALKVHQHALDGYRQAHPMMLAVIFFGTYVAFTALSLPAAEFLTAAAGALFGLLEGTLLASFASSIGSTVAFLASRYVFRDAVQRRFGRRLRAVNEGMQREGAAYLFTLRLIPVIPFFVVNLVMGLTELSARTFYWVSQIGMLPATLVYVNAGTQLAAVHCLSDIVSSRLLGSFLLLGLVTLLARWILARLKMRRM
jgi:uncharacterized membrane protein YdjX (TVP38/TMEM64 family)